MRFSRSGLKKRKRAKTAERGPRKKIDAPELADWQARVLEDIRSVALARELVFGGGSALSALYLHHRASEDLDFFLRRALQPADLAEIVGALRERGVSLKQRDTGPVRSLLLQAGRKDIGKIDFAYYPYAAADKPVAWQGLAVESILDMTLNKVQAVLTRFQGRDFVDLFFLLREGPKRRLDELLVLVEKKFGVGADRFSLGEALLRVREIQELPRMIRPLTLEALREFFWNEARELIRKG